MYPGRFALRIWDVFSTEKQGWCFASVTAQNMSNAFEYLPHFVSCESKALSRD